MAIRQRLWAGEPQAGLPRSKYRQWTFSACKVPESRLKIAGFAYGGR